MPDDLLNVVRDPQAERDLKRYFATYSGRWFERLSGGGDRAEVRDSFTADDILATQLLNVQVPAEVVIGLLEGDLGRDLAKLLADVDATVELGTPAAADLVADGASADRAWHRLKKQNDVNYVIAGKLLARKRPKLIPVYDRKVRCLFGGPESVWLKLHGQLAANGGVLRHELADLRVHAGVPAAVSVLRVLDVVLWMRHKGRHQENSCRYFATVPLS